MGVLSRNSAKLLERLSVFEPREFSVVVMPDFFLDRFVSWDGDVGQFSRSILEVAERKGGSIDNVAQTDFRGGNAVNTAAALAVLSVGVAPIVCTSKLGLNLLKLYIQPLDVDLSHVKIDDHPSITTALEFTHDKEKRNVMLRDLGSLQTVGPANLTEKDFVALKKADYVCVFNWAGTRTHGTELAKTVFEYVKTKGRGKTYYDTGDPLANRSRIPQLVEKVLLLDNLVDVLSVNENEAITYAGYVAPEQVGKLQKRLKSMPTLAEACAKVLAQELTNRIDLHTTSYSATFTGDEEVVVPVFGVDALRATGAGDAWNAGNIYADANDFPAELRLTFANAVAAYYLGNPDGEHPQLSQVLSFLREKVKT